MKLVTGRLGVFYRTAMFRESPSCRLPSSPPQCRPWFPALSCRISEKQPPPAGAPLSNCVPTLPVSYSVELTFTSLLFFQGASTAVTQHNPSKPGVISYPDRNHACIPTIFRLENLTSLKLKFLCPRTRIQILLCIALTEVIRIDDSTH